MDIILSISTSNLGASLGLLLVVFAITFLSLKLYQSLNVLIDKYDFTKQTELFTEHFKVIEDEYERMFLPDHETTDEDVSAFMSKYKDLFVQIEQLYEHKQFDSNVFGQAGCEHFLHYRCSAKWDKEQNNRIYLSIQRLENKSKKIMTSWKHFTREGHYFTDDEYKILCDAIDELDVRKLFDMIYPKYSDYVKDTDTYGLYMLLKSDRMSTAREEHNLLFNNNTEK